MVVVVVGEEDRGGQVRGHRESEGKRKKRGVGGEGRVRNRG